MDLFIHHTLKKGRLVSDSITISLNAMGLQVINYPVHQVHTYWYSNSFVGKISYNQNMIAIYWLMWCWPFQFHVSLYYLTHQTAWELSHYIVSWTSAWGFIQKLESMCKYNMLNSMQLLKSLNNKVNIY